MPCLGTHQLRQPLDRSFRCVFGQRLLQTFLFGFLGTWTSSESKEDVRGIQSILQGAFTAFLMPTMSAGTHLLLFFSPQEVP